MSALEELYNGNVCPCDRYVKKGSEYQKLSLLLNENEDTFLKMLSEDARTLYESIMEIHFQQAAISEKELFIDGFRLGAQIMQEIYLEPNRQLSYPFSAK